MSCIFERLEFIYIFFFNKTLKTNKSLCLSKWGILERVSKTFKITIKEKMMCLAGFHSFLLPAKLIFLVRERNVTWVFCLLILMLFCYQNTATKSFSSISFSNCFAPRIWKRFNIWNELIRFYVHLIIRKPW